MIKSVLNGIPSFGEITKESGPEKTEVVKRRVVVPLYWVPVAKLM